MNAYDSERMAAMLAQEGYVLVEGPEAADLIVINTCSVRERAEQKVYSYVGELKRLKAANPDLLIGVGGCVAQQEGGKLLKRLHHLDFVFGPGALEQLPALVAQAAQGRRQALTDLKLRPHASLVVPLNPGLKAQVTVMTGCDNFCSYCVVPYVRGRERSRPAPEIMAEVEALAAAGVREITLLGQNVNSYRDPAGGLDFAGLLEMVAEVAGHLATAFYHQPPQGPEPPAHGGLGRPGQTGRAVASARPVGQRPHPQGHEPGYTVSAIWSG